MSQQLLLLYLFFKIIFFIVISYSSNKTYTITPLLTTLPPVTTVHNKIDAPYQRKLLHVFIAAMLLKGFQGRQIEGFRAKRAYVAFWADFHFFED